MMGDVLPIRADQPPPARERPRDKWPRCLRCFGRLNNPPDRLCATCMHSDHHDDPEEDET